MTNSIVVKFIS